MSLISTYQSRKTLLANNLEKKNVSASGSDGLTTLINKVNQIQHFDDGLLLKANSKILQNGDTAKLSAMLISDDHTTASTSIDFHESNGILFRYKGKDGDTNESEWYCAEYLSITKDSTGTEVENGQSSDQFMLANKDGTSKSQWTDLADWNDGDSLSFNVLSLTGTVYLYANENVVALENTGVHEVSITLDNSYIGFKLEPGAILKIKDVIVVGEKVTSVTADAYGIANYDYSCVGAGIKQFQAVKGNIVSEPYEIIDAFVKDNCTTDTNLWTSSTATIDRTSGEYMRVTGTGSSNSIIFVKNNVNDIFDYTQSYAFEFDGLNVNASSIYVYVGSSSKGGISNPTSSDFSSIRLEYDASTQKIKIFKDGTQQGNDVSLTAFSSNFGIRLVDWQGDMDFKMKNFRAYLI